MNNNIFLLGQNGVKEYKFSPERLPAQKEKNQLDWVEFGDLEDWKNLQPQYYDYLARMSSKHGAALKAKDRYVYGKGFKINEAPLNRSEEVNLLAFLRTLKQDRLIKRLISDRNKYGGFAVEMIPSKGGHKVYPHYLPYKNIRVGKDVYDKEGNLEEKEYYYSTKWGESRSKIEGDPNFETFKEWDWEQDRPSTSDRYIVYFKDEGFEDDYYPLPDYQGGVPYIDADTEVGNFVMNNVKNGFTSGMLVQFFSGDPTPEQKAELETMWHEYLHGTDNAGKAMMTWLNNQDEEVKVTPLSPNGQDERFLNLNDQIIDEIFIAHTMSPMVVGLTGENGFSNNADEKRVAVEAFNEDFVEHNQQPFNEFVNELLRYNEIKGEVELQRKDPIKTQLSESTLVQIATNKELRDMYGLPTIEEDTNKVADALGTISPLVATKVLDNMTSAEIRAIVGLETGTGVTRTKVRSVTEFSKDEQDELILGFLSSNGEEDDKYEFIDSFELFAADIEDAEQQALKFKQEKFVAGLSETLLRLLNSNSKLTPNVLAKLAGVSEEQVVEELEKMRENGTISEDNEPNEKPEDEIFTVYKYEKRNDVSGPDIIDTSRDFCRRLVTLSRTRSWDINDIRRMSNGMGLDVFRSRGGWYTIPGTDRSVPYCRHIWKAFLVRRKRQ